MSEGGYIQEYRCGEKERVMGQGSLSGVGHYEIMLIFLVC